MEEKIGKRINLERTDEALATGAETDRHRLPVLPGDAHRRPDRSARTRTAAEDVEVLDVAQLLLAAVKRGDPAPDEKVDQLGDGAPGVDTTPLSGTQVNGAGSASAVTADAEGDVSVGGGSPGGASTKGANPDAVAAGGRAPGRRLRSSRAVRGAGWLGVPVDAIAEWSRAQQRVIDLVADLPPDRPR